MKILKWLSIADRLAKLYLDRLLAPLGINSSQHMFLIKICQQPGILQDSLIDMFYIHPSNIVRSVTALERNGFVSRVPYDKDKRTWQLYPTDKAKAIISEVQAACEKTEAVLLQEFTEEEAARFEETLTIAGKQITKVLNIRRKENESDARKSIRL